MTLGLINANPVVRAKKERLARTEDHHPVDPLEIYDYVRDIRDPEHPYSLEQLSVLSEESITVDQNRARIMITFTPTIQHCSMATVIGLCLREKLKDHFPPHFKVDIKVAAGSHADEESGENTSDADLFPLFAMHITGHHQESTVHHSISNHQVNQKINKQLNDKERIAAALENPNLRQLVEECLYSNEL